MLINDLTENGVFCGLLFRQLCSQFLLSWDVELKTPSVTIVDAGDNELKEAADAKGYPVIVYDNGNFIFPNGWKIAKEKRALLFTKLFHLMKKFYQLPDEIQISDNVKIHLINDWGERNSTESSMCVGNIFLLLSSYIYGGALRKDWFCRYDRNSMKSTLYRCMKKFYIQNKFSGSLIYVYPIAEKTKMLDFYFYEQDFRGELIVSERVI